MANYLDNLDEGQKRIADMVREQAQAQGVPVDLALSMAFAENGFRQFDQKGKVIASPAGALGIMQVMPRTAKEYGFSPKDLADPEKNIQAGVSVLKDFLGRSGGDAMMAAGMYNAGPNHPFFKTGKGDLPQETQNYIAKINGFGGFGEGESAPNEPKALVEVEPAPNEATPGATVHTPDEADPALEAQKNKEFATAAGATLGAGVGFAKSRMNAVENRIIREEAARLKAQQQIAKLNPQPKPAAAPVEPSPRVGALPAAPGSPQLKGAQKWVQSLGNQVPYAIAEQAETMDKVRATGGQSLLNKDAEAMAKIRGMGEGRFQLTGEGRGQLMLPPGVADQAAQQQAQAAANEERLARIAADTDQARQIRLQQQEANRPINQARSVLKSVGESPLGQIGARVAETAFKRLPVIGYGAAGASMGRNVSEIDQAMQNKEYIDALIAASQLAATGASMYPPFAPIAVPAALGLEAVKQARDYYR